MFSIILYLITKKIKVLPHKYKGIENWIKKTANEAGLETTEGKKYINIVKNIQNLYFMSQSNRID